MMGLKISLDRGVGGLVGGVRSIQFRLGFLDIFFNFA